MRSLFDRLFGCLVVFVVVVAAAGCVREDHAVPDAQAREIEDLKVRNRELAAQVETLRSAADERERADESARRERERFVDSVRMPGLGDRAVRMEPVECRVVAVDLKLKLVQFNVGSNRKVVKGYMIDIMRGQTYIGRVRIDQVYGDNCAGTLVIAAPGQAPAVGDRGTNTLLEELQRER